MIGHAAGCATEYSSHNTFVGNYAGYDNNRTNGPSGEAMHNTYMGSYTGYTNREGNYNVGIGAFADFRSVGYIGDNDNKGNVFIGYESMIDEMESVAIGYYARVYGRGTVGIGAFTDYDVNTVDYGVGLGYGGFANNANNSIGIGRQHYLNTADQSVGIGAYDSITADYGIAIGYGATSSGVYSSTLGHTSNVSGDSAIAIGAYASAEGYNSIAIGFGTTVTASNEVFIGNASTTSIGGTVNWTATSDGRFKTNVESNVPGLDFINRLTPVTYNFDTQKLNSFNHSGGLSKEKAGVRYSGFIAQDVHQAAQELGYDFSGVKVPENEDEEMYGLRYAEFVVPLVKATQELSQKLDEQQKQIDAQNNILSAQQELIDKYNQTLSSYEEAVNSLKAELEKLEVEVHNKAELEASAEEDK